MKDFSHSCHINLEDVLKINTSRNKQKIQRYSRKKVALGGRVDSLPFYRKKTFCSYVTSREKQRILRPDRNVHSPSLVVFKDFPFRLIKRNSFKQ